MRRSAPSLIRSLSAPPESSPAWRSFGLFAVKPHPQRAPGRPCPVEPGAPNRLERHALAQRVQPGVGDGGERLESAAAASPYRHGRRGSSRLLEVWRERREIGAGADHHLAAVRRCLARAFEQHAGDLAAFEQNVVRPFQQKLERASLGGNFGRGVVGDNTGKKRELRGGRERAVEANEEAREEIAVLGLPLAAVAATPSGLPQRPDPQRPRLAASPRRRASALVESTVSRRRSRYPAGTFGDEEAKGGIRTGIWRRPRRQSQAVPDRRNRTE